MQNVRKAGKEILTWLWVIREEVISMSSQERQREGKEKLNKESNKIG